MPSTSKKQHRFMAAVANNPEFAKKAGVPQTVGKEFIRADAAKSRTTAPRPNAQSVNKPATNQGRSELFSKGGTMATKKSAPFMGKESAKEEKAEAKGGKSCGKAYAKGGYVRAADGIVKKGKTKGKII